LLEKEPVDEFNFEHLIRDLKKELNIDDSLCAELLKRSKMSPNQAASQIGHFLVKNVIENCGHKRANRGILSRAFVTLASTPIAASFCDGVTKSLLQYFECRDQLRGQEEFIAIWLNFVALAYEFVQISQEGTYVTNSNIYLINMQYLQIILFNFFLMFWVTYSVSLSWIR